MDPDELSGEGGQRAQNPGVDSMWGGGPRWIILSDVTLPKLLYVYILSTYGSSGPGRGKSWTNVTFFFKSQRLLRTEKSKYSYTFKSYYLILASRVLKIWVSGFRSNLGCAQYAQSWVFFKTFKIELFLLLYYSGSKIATAMVFIWGDRGYPAVRFEYKTASWQYLVEQI